MGWRITLGQGSVVSLGYNPLTKTVSWSAPGYIDVQVYVNGELFSSGESGRESASWIQRGQSYEFKLIARRSPGAFSEYLATFTVDANGEVPPATGGGGGSGTAAPPVSWFDQSTMILGEAVPNLYLTVGGGLLFLAAVAAMKRRS